MRYWLIKSEPTEYSIDDFKKEKSVKWTGVRNYAARNFLREMCPEDRILFYHSSVKIPTIMGTGRVTSQPYHDPTQFNPESSYFDPKATKVTPRWSAITISYKETFPSPVTLYDIKNDPFFQSMILIIKGSRLSVQPVSKNHFERIIKKGYA